jgi:hypothetical protein
VRSISYLFDAVRADASKFQVRTLCSTSPSCTPHRKPSPPSLRPLFPPSTSGAGLMP